MPAHKQKKEEEMGNRLALIFLIVLFIIVSIVFVVFGWLVFREDAEDSTVGTVADTSTPTLVATKTPWPTSTPIPTPMPPAPLTVPDDAVVVDNVYYDEDGDGQKESHPILAIVVKGECRLDLGEQYDFFYWCSGTEVVFYNPTLKNAGFDLGLIDGSKAGIDVPLRSAVKFVIPEGVRSISPYTACTDWAC